MRKILKRILIAPLFLVAFLLVVIEDEIWHRAVLFNAKYLKNNKYLLQLEVSTKSWSVWKCFSLFLVPLVVLFPIKLAAMFMISKGHFVIGTALFLSIKLLGAALSAKIYSMTESTLRTLSWFAKFVDYASGLRKKMTTWIVSSKMYTLFNLRKQELKAYLMGYKSKTKSRIYRMISRFKLIIKKK